MITWFGSFSTPVAEVFRDDQRADVFYYLRHEPRIATDTDGAPLFFYHLIARDVQLAYASGTADHPAQYQVGMLGLHVDLGLNDDELAVVKAACRAQMQPAGNLHFRLFGLGRPAVSEPTVAAINTWLDGSARIDLVVPDGPTFKLSGTTEAKPSLYGDNAASFTASFGAEGAQLMYDSLGGRHQPTDPPVTVTGLPVVSYELTFAARSPALKVTVTAHGSAVYEELRNTTQVTESTSKGTWSYPQVAELTKKLVANRAIEIVWEDNGLPDATVAGDSEARQQIEENLISLVTTKIVETFFTEYQVKGLQDGDLGEDPFLHSGAGSGKPGNRLWLRDYKEEFVSDISFSLTRTQNTVIRRNPNMLLGFSAGATADQIASRVKFLDVGNPETQILDIAIYCNADFANDNIAQVQVDLDYDQADALIGGDHIKTDKSVVFTTGKEIFHFVTRLARDAEHRLIDLYDATARIIYIGRSQSPPAMELKGLSERALTVSYDRLGFVKVDIQAGDIDWNEVTAAYVDLEYPGAPGEPDARKQLKLSQDHPTAAWSVSKHGATSASYRYSVRYQMKDGSEQEAPARTDDRSTLVIHDLLAARLRRTFDVVLDPATVKAVLVRVRYRDEAHGIDETARNLFSATGSWDYARPIIEGAPRAVDYGVLIQYADGAQEERPWVTLGADDPTPVLAARRFKFSVIVDGTRLDWHKWATAYAYLEYDDADHDYHLATDAPLRITSDQALARFDVMAFSATARSYRYRVTMVPLDGAPIDVPADGTLATTDRGVLLLHTLVT
ncbi:MAG TPA: hypothetical protein VHE35_35495 [Kofleriaceae bacterium]|nr:hypothetical protein [Kofleriaceae bacterium]